MSVTTHRFRTPTKIITTQEPPHNTSCLFFITVMLMDGILSTDYWHAFKLFLLVFLGWIAVVVPY